MHYVHNEVIVEEGRHLIHPGLLEEQGPGQRLPQEGSSLSADRVGQLTSG